MYLHTFIHPWRPCRAAQAPHSPMANKLARSTSCSQLSAAAGSPVTGVIGPVDAIIVAWAGHPPCRVTADGGNKSESLRSMRVGHSGVLCLGSATGKGRRWIASR